MAVKLTGSDSLFTRWGKNLGLANTLLSNQAEIIIETDDILDEYQNNRDLAFIYQQSLPGFIASVGSPLSLVGTVCTDTVVEMVDDDDPLPSKVLNQALDRLREQMEASDDDINGTTVSSSISSAGLVTGTGEQIVHLIDRFGNRLEHVRAEDIISECTADAQESGTAGRETFSVNGEESVANLDNEWPAGSGIGGSTVVTDPSVDASDSVAENRGTNTDFEGFTANAPTGWTIEVGVAGTDIKSTTTKLRGTNALEIVGDGATLSAISQPITIKPETVYCIGLWVRDDGTPPAAGVLQASLQNSSDAVYNTATALTTASVSITLSGVGSTYAFSSISFATPRLLEAGGTTARLWLELTTALTSPRSVFIDGMFIAEMQQYGGLGGPFMLITPGDTDFIRGDRFNATITNNNEGGFVRGLDRFFDMYGLGKYIRSVTDGSETISDSLIS